MTKALDSERISYLYDILKQFFLTSWYHLYMIRFVEGFCMNRLNTVKRVQLVAALVEGSSINSIVWMTGDAKCPF